MDANIDPSQKELMLHFPAGMFSVTSIKKAAYRFSDALCFDFSVTDQGVDVRITPVKSLELSQLEKLAKKFKTEVLDNDLRAQISQETEPIRNAVLAFAFSKTGLQEN